MLAEVLLRVFAPADNRYYIWLPNHSATLNPQPGLMPGVGPIAHFHVNSQGIIGREWASERDTEYRILTIGGSTTECLYLDQDKSWPALLQQGLGATPDGRTIWVGNLGKAGFNTRDHLALMRLAIDQYDVDAIVMLIGGNDLVHRLIEGDSYDPRFTEKEVEYRAWLVSRFASVPPSMDDVQQSILRRTALWQLARRLNRLYKSWKAPIVQDEAGDWLVRMRKARQTARLIKELPDLNSGLDEYERNVTAIIQEAQRRSIRIVLVTQPTFWKANAPEAEHNLLWMGWRPDGSFYTTEALAKAIDAYNQRLLATAEKLNVECVDLAARLPRSLDVFYDDMHFNEHGSQLVSERLADHFRVHDAYGPRGNGTARD